MDPPMPKDCGPPPPKAVYPDIPTAFAHETNSTSNALTRLFFIHPRAVDMWKQHPNVLLLDCTYKTNRFNMPLLNICAISGNNRVTQVGLVLLSGEKKGDYRWACQQLRNVMAACSIQEPVSIVTDRELALMDSLDTLFPESTQLLCRWHVNMNVLAKSRPSSVSDSVTAVQIFRFKGVKVQVYRLFSPKEAVKCWILSA
jgi:hypothetical protein